MSYYREIILDFTLESLDKEVECGIKQGVLSRLRLGISIIGD